MDKRMCCICHKNPAVSRSSTCASLDCIEAMRRSWTEERLLRPDGFITATEYARAYGVTVQWAVKLCKAGKLPGSFQDEKSGRWYIPADDKKDAVILPSNVEHRKMRRIFATDKEWRKICELAARTKYSVNEYILRVALGKPVAKEDSHGY